MWPERSHADLLLSYHMHIQHTDKLLVCQAGILSACANTVGQMDSWLVLPSSVAQSRATLLWPQGFPRSHALGPLLHFAKQYKGSLPAPQALRIQVAEALAGANCCSLSLICKDFLVSADGSL